jgi:hypothetical protein
MKNSEESAASISRLEVSALKMGTVHSFETTVNIYQNTRRHVKKGGAGIQKRMA